MLSEEDRHTLFFLCFFPSLNDSFVCFVFMKSRSQIPPWEWQLEEANFDKNYATRLVRMKHCYKERECDKGMGGCGCV